MKTLLQLTDWYLSYEIIKYYIFNCNASFQNLINLSSRLSENSISKFPLLQAWNVLS